MQASNDLKASLVLYYLCSFTSNCLGKSLRPNVGFSVSRVGVCVILQLLLPISLFTAAVTADICSFGVGALLYSAHGAFTIVC